MTVLIRPFQGCVLYTNSKEYGVEGWTEEASAGSNVHEEEDLKEVKRQAAINKSLL